MAVAATVIAAAATVIAARAAKAAAVTAVGDRRSWPARRRGDRGPRREREGGGDSDSGPAPEFAPAFLTGDKED